MKKKGLFLLGACALLVAGLLTGCGDKQKLSIYLPGEYMSDELIPTFEEMYDCKVDVELFDSNEMMYAKFMAGGNYDILIPSDYMIERLILEDQLQKIDVSKIENFDKIVPEILQAPYNEFDPNNDYSVPYFWGTVGIVYNETVVPQIVVEKEGFEVFRNTDYAGKIYMYDSERDSFMMAFKSLGYSMNTSSDDEINDAYD